MELLRIELAVEVGGRNAKEFTCNDANGKGLFWFEGQLIFINRLSTTIEIKVDVVARTKAMRGKKLIQSVMNLPSKSSFPHPTPSSKEGKAVL